MRVTLFLIVFITSIVFPQQWQMLWNSSQIDENTLSGWFQFEKTEKGWKNMLYTLDSNEFRVMESGTSSNPLYIHTFTEPEKLAGNQLYALLVDFNGDNKTEFYVLSHFGTSDNYRQAVKIFDITNNSVIFEKNESNFSYSYPTLVDIDADGFYECAFSKWDFPYVSKYYLEVYSTNVPVGLKPEHPVRFTLKQNYPNPFNPSTKIEYDLNQLSNVELTVFSITGEKLKTLVNEMQPAGNYELTWNGTDDYNNKLPTGIYFYELKAGNQNFVKKMLILK